MFKRFLLLIVVVFTFSAVIINAQPRPPQPPSAEDKINMLKEKLNLTDDQVTELKSIFESTKKKMDEMREKMEESKKESMDEMKSVMDKEDEAVVNVLTDEQKEKYEELKKEREAHKPPMGAPRGQRPDCGGGRPPRGE